MATGIGEASAILSVAQIGISLSKSLITYIEEVRGAPSHIRRIGNEILTTSERLKDVGELVIQNPRTKVFSEEGINSAVRCSTECQQIIDEVANVLCKSGWQEYPKASDKDEVDTSLFSILRWPFAKLKLEVPRAELHRIKLDLSLLFSAAMVLGASTTAAKQRLAQDIPGLHKARAWAARRAEKVKEMAQHRPMNPRAPDTPWSEDEPEMLEEFLTFKERAFREEEEKMIKERARVIQAEDDARKRKEEDTQREVERKAVEEYKKNQKEQEARSAEKRENFRKELERLGLESAQIQMVMESSNLDFQAASATAFVPEVRPSSSSREISGEQEPTPSATSGLSRLNMPWWRSKKFTRESSSEPSLNSMLSESSTGPRPHLEFQTWLIDFCTNQETEVFPSAEWLIAKLKTIKKDQDVWTHFANLAPHERHRILAFLGHHRREEPEWTLYHLQISRRFSRTRLFRQRRDEQLVQLILCRRRVNDQDSDVLRVGSKPEGPGGGLPKHVSFAEGLEESGAERGVKSNPDYAVRRSDRDLRERIARLEVKRNELGVHDQERIADLNDMIDYLQDRLKPDATDISARDTMSFHDERQPEPLRSDSNRGPAIVHEEVTPNSSQRNDIIRFVDRFGRSSTAPLPHPSQKLDNMDDISVASHYPQGTYEDLEIIEDSSQPGRTSYEARYGARDNSRNWPRERRRSRRDEEDIFLVSRNHDRSSQIGWQERSRSRSRPSRQDSFDTRGGPIVSRDIRERDRSWERIRPQPVQPSRQLSQETGYYDRLERARVKKDRIRPRKRASEREEEGWPPEMRQIVIRRDGIYKPTPRDRQYFSSSGSEHSFNGSRIRRGQPMAGKSGESQALVLRSGAYGTPYEYVRERVLNGGIRVRDESPEPAVSQHVRRLSRPQTSRRNSYRDRSWAPSLRRRHTETWHQFDSNAFEHSGYPRVERNDSGNDKPETELSDAEVIAQTLKQLTTIQDSDMPTTGTSAPPARTKPASEMEVGRSALKNAPYASSGPERKRSLPVPGRKAHFEQENGSPQTAQDGQGRVTNENSDSIDEKTFLNRISEEPDVMNEDSDIPHHQRVVYFPQRPVLPHPQQNSPFPSPPDLASYSREVSPRAQSRDSDLVIDEVRSTQGEQPDHAPQEEEGDDEVEVIRTLSRNPTVDEGLTE